MKYTNNAMLNRRHLMKKVGELVKNGELEEKIDRVPLQMHPKDNSSVRCCVHKDRSVTKYKLMAIMGFDMAEETDELTPLSEYAQNAPTHSSPIDNPLTIVDDACSSCIKVNYSVTDHCKGCEARPCELNCPKDSVSIINGKAHIDHSSCVNCGLCMKVCPYHAIIYMPVPCEEACPVGAIYKNENGKEQIDDEKCIYCGKCMSDCPFGAIMEKSEMVPVMQGIKDGGEYTALVAPALIGQFKTDFESILGGLKKLGFKNVVEVADGAEVTIKNEASELIERLEDGDSFMTSSCCPAYTNLTQKHLKGLQKYVSHTQTPLFYTAETARKKYQNSKIVFISPCVSKRKEVKSNPNVDFVLTFEEIGTLLIAHKIDVLNVTEKETLNPETSNYSRGFAASGGVSKALKSALGDDVKEVVINGIDKSSLRELKKMDKGKSIGNFVEVMSCEEGCIGGPCTISNPKVAQRLLNVYTEKQLVEVESS